MFEIRDGLILYSSNRPGNHATMFDPRGAKLPFRSDRSSFSDEARSYTWAFVVLAKSQDGFYVFSTSDYEDTCEVEGGVVRAPSRPISVRRGEGGKPERALLPEIPRKHLVVGTQLVQRSGPARGLRCMFVNPSVPYGQWNCYRAGVMNEGSFSAHGMAYVSATLKNDGHHCWLVDLRSCQNWPHVASTFAAQEYDVAFVGFLSIDAFNAAAVVRLLKEIHPDRPVVVGGLHVSIAKEREFPRADLVDYYCHGNHDLLPDVFRQFLAWKGEGSYEGRNFPLADYVILDDGEIAARDLVAAFAAGRVPSERTIEGGAVPMEVARHLDRDLFNLDIEANSPILPFQPTPMVTVTWARGCPFRCSYCFGGGMFVHTEHGFEEIATIARRDEPVRVVQADGRLGRATTFSERSYRGTMVRVSAHYMNHPIEATPNHRVRVQDATGLWQDKEVSALTLGDRLFVPAPHGERVDAIDVVALLAEAGEEPQRIGDRVRLRDGKNTISAMIEWSDDLLFLLGIYLAEGCVTYSGSRPNSVALAFTFGGHEKHLVDRVIRSIKEIFGVEARLQEQRTGIQAWCGVGVVAKIFEYLCGSCSAEKRLHRWLLGLPADQFLSVAAAWLIGDGNPGATDHHNSYTSGSTVSPSLGWGLWSRLLGHGVAASLHRKKRPAACREIEGRQVEIEEFFYEIGFHCSAATRTLVSLAFGERGRLPSKLQHPMEWCEGGALLPISKLETFWGLDPVFNMEVLPDHTYTVNGTAVHNCNLASQLSNTNVRQKTADLVEEELDDLHRRFGGRIGSLMIHDDLTFDIKHIAEWCDLILRKYGPIPIWMQTRADWIVTRYRKNREFWELLCLAGLTWVSVGFESGSQRVLDFMQKDNTVEKNVEAARILDEYGINAFANFLWGVPTETREEAEATVSLVQQIRPGFLSGSVYCNYPGTQLDKWCRDNGYLIEGSVYTRSHLPWQVTIKGIDYGHVYECLRRAGEAANYLRMPKMLSEDRKRDLAATARGLPIH